MGLAAFVGAGKGTVATLLDQEIFSIVVDSGASKRAGEGRPLGGLGATNHTEHPDTRDTLRKQAHSVTYSAPAENGASPFPSDAALSARMTEAEAQESAFEIRNTEGADSDLVLVPLERVKQWAIDWHIKSGLSGWIINGKPMRDARLALRGYLRKAAAATLDRFEEFKDASPRTAIKPDDGEDDNIPF